ncbi:hypothetical protein GQ600_21724 [Phytophthora cactorum]|nr:hypothetical protein GQ600_21724 [Phytophthora cactorum]
MKRHKRTQVHELSAMKFIESKRQSADRCLAWNRLATRNRRGKASCSAAMLYEHPAPDIHCYRFCRPFLFDLTIAGTSVTVAWKAKRSPEELKPKVVPSRTFRVLRRHHGSPARPRFAARSRLRELLTGPGHPRPMQVVAGANVVAMDTSSAAFDKVTDAATRNTNDKSQIQKKA